MKQKICFISLGTMILLSGCAEMPAGPSVMVLPGSRSTFDQFRQDDYACRQFASGQMGGAVGMSEGSDAAMVNQEDYDKTYIQCMYAKGQRVPVSGKFINKNQQPVKKPATHIPPPPPGPPPPPPLK